MTSLAITASLLSAAHLGAKNTGAYFLAGLNYIPGRTLLGAAAWAWIDAGGDPDSQAFKDRFLSGNVSWGDLLPVPVDTTTQTFVADIPIHPPRTTLACKLFGSRHGLVDTLLSGSGGVCTHSIGGRPCGAGLKRLDHLVVPNKQHRTHLAIAYQTGTARSGYLYSREVVQEGQVFRGRLCCADPVVAGALRDELQQLSLSVGSGRSRGSGLLRLEVTEEDHSPGLTLEKFVQDSEQVVALRKSTTENLRYFTLTAGSPWFLRESDSSHARTLSAQQLAKLVGVPASQVNILAGEARAETRSGWDGAAGLPIEIRSLIAAGSTFLCSVSDGSDADLVAALNGLADRGIGGHRVEGLGRVIVNHPLHFNTSYPEANRA
jgi:hypothetical protein